MCTKLLNGSAADSLNDIMMSDELSVQNKMFELFSAGAALFFVLSAVVITGHANYTFPLIIITKKPLLQLLAEK